MARLNAFILAAGVSIVSFTGLQAQTSPANPVDTGTFVTIAVSTGNFIDEAGRLALATESGKAVQGFARAAVFEQSDARGRIGPWASATQPIVTGRSAVVTNDLPPPLADLSARLTEFTRANKAAETSLSRTAGGMVVTGGQLTLLDDLQSRTGSDFDRAYVESQRIAYRTLEAAYKSYADAGDDPTLRKAAKRELPVLQRLLKRLDTL